MTKDKKEVPQHPMKLLIGFKTYKIEHKDLSEDDLHGYVDLTTNVIYVDPNQSDSDYRGTLLHEITHVVFHMFGLGDDDEMPGIKNEFLTTITSNGFQLFASLNHELFLYLFEKPYNQD
jgi:Zn-dependent peptidase ImmA (M78 family)|tara:strand:+ start:2045 stop:2401 length:357 start_codon:yes stop_codon:yes gene_type:complete